MSKIAYITGTKFLEDSVQARLKMQIVVISQLF